MRTRSRALQFRIWQCHVVSAPQAPLRRGHDPPSFRLVDTQLSTTGAVLLVYDRVGDLTHGEVEVGQDTVIFD